MGQQNEQTQNLKESTNAHMANTKMAILLVALLILKWNNFCELIKMLS